MLAYFNFQLYVKFNLVNLIDVEYHFGEISANDFIYSKKGIKFLTCSKG